MSFADEIAIVDYGAGNLRSVSRALEAVGARVRIATRAEDLRSARKIVLPGVGAFGDGMAGLTVRGLVEPLRRAAQEGVPILGICLGMQLFFPASEESPGVEGLGFLPGEVRAFRLTDLKVPHTGWNQIWPKRPTPLLDGLKPGDYAYFNHGYYCAPAEEADVLAVTDYGLRYASVVGRGNLYGVQFHPEKSQAVGLRILRNFVRLGSGGEA